MPRTKLAALLLIATLTACAGRPQISGLPIGDTRIVSLGDVVELRVPIDAAGNRTWRVSAYDSLYLSLVDAPRVNERGDMLVARAKARMIGSTEVELVSVTTGGTAPERVRFKIEIVP